WKVKKSSGRARFVGEEIVLSTLTDALARRREAAPGTDATEAVGLLTHHLEHDPPSWAFLEALVWFIQDHPGVTWIPAIRGL
ncbi:MAG: hypothetical protein P1V34_07080, partial [Alphaproteobacteria bacterium]|nr:hypothetical protein [Alphaproteobacteria bacterium]